MPGRVRRGRGRAARRGPPWGAACVPAPPRSACSASADSLEGDGDAFVQRRDPGGVDVTEVPVHLRDRAGPGHGDVDVSGAQRCSMRPNRQRGEGRGAQVSTNSPTMPKPTITEVQRGDPGERPRIDAEAVDDQPGEHDQPDDQGDGHRQQCDGQVVEDLAHRLEERPTVGPGHQDPVGRVEKTHAGREQHRQHEDRVPGQHERRRSGREHQQGDLGRGVEAQAHEQADRVEVPRLADPPGHAIEQPAEKAAVVQVPLESASSYSPVRIRRKTRAMPTAAVRFIRPMSSRNTPATIVPTSASVAPTWESLALDDVWRPSAPPAIKQQAGGDDDRGVAEGEPEARADRGPALADELAGGVVDGRDVVGIEGVPDAEHVRRQADADPEHARAAQPVVVRGDREQPGRPSRRGGAAGRSRPDAKGPPVVARAGRRARRRGPGAHLHACGHGRRAYCELFATSTPGSAAAGSPPCG